MDECKIYSKTGRRTKSCFPNGKTKLGGQAGKAESRTLCGVTLFKQRVVWPFEGSRG